MTEDIREAIKEMSQQYSNNPILDCSLHYKMVNAKRNNVNQFYGLNGIFWQKNDCYLDKNVKHLFYNNLSFLNYS